MTLKNWTVHRIAADDFAVVCEELLVDELYDAQYGLDGVGLKQLYLEAGYGLVALWVARIDQQQPIAVGVVSMNGPLHEIQLYTHPAYRRQGVGFDMALTASAAFPEAKAHYTETSASIWERLGVAIVDSGLAG